MWSCALVQTPPSWPVIQPSGRSFGQVASTANFGAFWACRLDVPSAAATATPAIRQTMDFIVRSLFEFPAAEIDRFHRAHIGDVVEWILRQHQEVGGLAGGERSKVTVDAEHLRVVLRERLNDLHRGEPGITHQLHLAMLEEALDEVAVRRAAGIGSEPEADAGIGELLEVFLV